MDPLATSRVEVITNLAGPTPAERPGPRNPFFGLLANYDGTQSLESGLAEGSYAYSDALDVYDADGQSHELTFFFDPVPSANLSTPAAPNTGIPRGLDPADDGRAPSRERPERPCSWRAPWPSIPRAPWSPQSAFSYREPQRHRLSNWTPSAPVGGFFQVNPTYASSAGTPISVNFGLSLMGPAGSTVSNATGVGLNRPACPATPATWPRAPAPPIPAAPPPAPGPGRLPRGLPAAPDH